MSNGTGTGKQTGPAERSARGSVRSLFAHEAEGGAIATEEWYETERLTGQITGRARATDRRPESVQQQVPLALEWRHAEVSPSPKPLVRLRRRLERGHRRTTATESHVAVTASRGAREVPSQGLGSRVHEGSTDAVASQTGGDPPSPARDDAGARTSERLEWRFPPGAIASSRSGRPRLRRVAILGGIALSLAVSATIAIASETGRNSPKRSPARLLEGASPPTPGLLAMATDRVVLALGTVGHEARASADRAARTRRHPHVYPVRTRSRSSSSRSETVATQQGSTSAPVVSANVTSTSSYRNSSSSPAYSSQTPRTEAATSARAQGATSAPQPAGPTSLGGAVGTNCNPKCR